MGIWKITEPWQEMLKLLHHKDIYISGAEQIQSERRKQEWLAVRLLLEQLAGPEVTIEYDEYGAPLLHNSAYNISISHTTGFAAVILNDKPYAGIDIEYHSERAWRLREKYLSENELEMFIPLYKDKQRNVQPATGEQAGSKQKSNRQCCNELATLCWCAKETAYKALNQSEVDFIGHLHIQPFILSEKGIFLLKETRTPQQETFFIHYRITEDYIITWTIAKQTNTN